MPHTNTTAHTRDKEREQKRQAKQKKNHEAFWFAKAGWPALLQNSAFPASAWTGSRRRKKFCEKAKETCSKHFWPFGLSLKNILTSWTTAVDDDGQHDFPPNLPTASSCHQQGGWGEQEMTDINWETGRTRKAATIKRLCVCCRCFNLLKQGRCCSW